MAGASERVEHDGAARGRKARIEVPHENGKSAASLQNLGIARREPEGPFIGFARLPEVEGSNFRNDCQCQVGLSQIRREDKRLARICLRLVKASRTAVPVAASAASRKSERSARERERIVRIQADGFRVRSNRGGEIFAFMPRAICRCSAQIRIEGGRIARPAKLDFSRDIREQRDFKSAGHRGGNLGLKFQHIA